VLLLYKCNINSEQLQMNTNKIMGVQFFHTYIPATAIDKDYGEYPCYSKIPNCAICGGFDSAICKMCIDGFALQNLTTAAGQVKSMCMYDFCPVGHYLSKSFNGIAYCTPCSVKNCNTCGRLEYEDGVHDVCIQCQGGFMLSTLKNECYDIFTYHIMQGLDVPAEIKRKIFKKMDFLIEPRSNINLQTMTTADLEAIE